MRSGRGGALHPTIPWVVYRGMTDDDLDALFAALQTLPPVRHWVNNVDPPTACLVCGGTHGMGDQNVRPVFEPSGVSLGPLDAYAGRYTFEIWMIEISARDGRLWASDGGAAIELVATAGGRFAGHGLVSPFAFERDGAGRIVALTMFEVGTTRWVREPSVPAPQ